MPEPEDMAMSNPISILTRRCQILGQTPQFELRQVEGAAHCPLFTVEASLSGRGEQLAAEGKGASKRIAKEEAARNLLLQLETSPQPTVDNVAPLCPMPIVQERPPAPVKPAEDSIDIKLKQLEKLKLEIEIEQMRTSLQQQRDVSRSNGGHSNCCDRWAFTCVGTENSMNVNNNKIDIRGYKSSWSQTINCNALGSSGSYHKYLDTGTGICPETKIVNGKDDVYKSRAYVHDQQQLIPTSIESFPNTSAGSDGNSVGRLQEFCMKRGASPPRYNERSCGVSGAKEIALQ